jgi:predicted aspartyl protease
MWAVFPALAFAAIQAGQPAIPASAPAQQAAPPTQAELVAFRSDPVLRMTIPIEIAGTTQHFLIDTGAQRTGISIELARALELEDNDPLLVTGFAGTSLVPTYDLPPVKFSRDPRKNLRALAFKRSWIGADGFLGLDALRGKRVVFNFSDSEMIVENAPMKAKPVGIGANAAARIKIEHDQLVFADATVDRLRAKAILDTGSSISVGNEALRRELARRGRLGPAVPVKILAVTGEVIDAQYVIVKNLWIGEVRISNMPVAFAGDGEPFDTLGFDEKPALLLGMDALRLFDKVAIDFANHQVSFSRGERPGETFWRITWDLSPHA